MSSVSRVSILALLAAAASQAGVLRVCADPNNMPYSNREGQGFENKLAELVAHSMGRSVEYVWWPQRQTFLRYTLLENRCDVVMGVSAGAERLQTTRPYYRSSFVFVTRRNPQPAFHSLDDARLRKMRIGLHVVGEDYSSVPPGQALADRGITGNIKGYTIYGDYSQANPRAPLIDAVASGDVDVAIVWGPLAGYFANRENPALAVTPLTPSARDKLLPFSFDIAMGVRPADTRLKNELDNIISQRSPQIRKILLSYDVPLSRLDQRGFTR